MKNNYGSSKYPRHQPPSFGLYVDIHGEHQLNERNQMSFGIIKKAAIDVMNSSTMAKVTSIMIDAEKELQKLDGIAIWRLET